MIRIKKANSKLILFLFFLTGSHGFTMDYKFQETQDLGSAVSENAKSTSLPTLPKLEIPDNPQENSPDSIITDLVRVKVALDGSLIPVNSDDELDF